MKRKIYLSSAMEGIPIPGNDFILDISSQHEDLINLYKEESDKEYIYLAFSKELSHFEFKRDNKALDQIFRIGVRCSLLEREEINDSIAYYLHAINYFIISDLLIEVNPQTSVLEIVSDTYPLIEDMCPGEEPVFEQIAKAILLFVSKKNFLTSALKEQIKNSEDLMHSLNLVANFVIKDEEKKLEYIQTKKKDIKLFYVLHAVKAFGKKRKNQRPEEEEEEEEEPSGCERKLSFRERIEKKEIPQSIFALVKREVDRLEEIPKSSSEYSSNLDYLNWVFDLPWETYSSTKIDLRNFKEELNKTHYGLEDIKDRILEHFIIDEISGSTNGSILCFLGPPGTGKTSIVSSIASASNRKLERIALGGLSDESDLRGHRRTYVASRPGRVITGLRRAKTMDPLFLLDELDKASSGRQDISSALLEILDPEQNTNFIDRYLEIPVDISKIMFICTANYENQIPEALKDRMEIIRFREYTKKEKETITKNYIITKFINKYNMSSYDISFTDSLIEALSEKYNIREIERQIKSLLRKAAVKFYFSEITSLVFDESYLKDSSKTNTKTKLGF